MSNTMEHASVSVIIPVRNASATFDRCLSAVEAQLHREDELIIVDNNSTDDSRAIATRRPRVRMLTAEKDGAYVARNVGCQAARQQILVFLDPDCEPVPGWRRSIGGAFNDPSTELVIGSRAFARDGSLLGLLAEYENDKAQWVYGQSDPLLYFGYTNNMAVRSALWHEVGPFVERRRGSDTIFVRRVVDRLLPSAARYVHEMRVRHLEVDSLSTYCCKMRIYGRSRQLYQRIVKTRPLSNKERLRILRMTLGAKRRPLAAALLIVPALAIGLACWAFGSRSARWSRGRAVAPHDRGVDGSH